MYEETKAVKNDLGKLHQRCHTNNKNIFIGEKLHATIM